MENIRLLAKSSLLRWVAIFGAGALCAVLVVYLTPLKNLNLIEPRIRDIDSKEFYTALQNDPSRYVFIDVRPQSEYQQEHAKGSFNIALFLLYDERKNLPKSGKTIVLICGGRRASGVAYGYLEHYGFLNLRRIAGGIDAWKAAGLPTEGEAVERRERKLRRE